MPLFHRRDSLLLAGLAVALVVIFAAPLVQVLELAREVERQNGLALVSGLVLLTGVFAMHQLQKRHEMQAQAVAAQVALQQAEARAQELERLVTFGHALTRSLDYEAIKSAVEQYLPRVAGTDAIWVLLRKGTSWEPLAGDARGAGDAIDREDFAERVLCGVSDVPPTARVAFPLVAGGTAIGVVGVNRDTSGQERPGTVEAAAAILAVSLKNAQLFHEVRENFAIRRRGARHARTRRR